MNEAAVIDKYLTATLKADATLISLVGARVYNSDPPTNPTFPYIIFNYQAGRDVQGNGSNRNMSRDTYQVRAVVQGPPSATAHSIADRIDAILQNTSAVVYGGLVLSIRRIGKVSRAERAGDPEQKYFNLGGLYQVDAQAA